MSQPVCLKKMIDMNKRKSKENWLGVVAMDGVLIYSALREEKKQTPQNLKPYPRPKDKDT